MSLTIRMPRGYLPIIKDTPVLIPHLAARLLRSISQAKTKSRKRELPLIIVIPLELLPSIHLKLQRGDIIFLKKFFEQDSSHFKRTEIKKKVSKKIPEEELEKEELVELADMAWQRPLQRIIAQEFLQKPHLEFLTKSLAQFFFSDPYLKTLRKPPRGKSSKVFPLTSLLPGALLVCRELVVKAYKEAEEGREYRLGNRIREIVEEMKEEGDSYWTLNRVLENSFPPHVIQDFVIICLVQRAFQGAWEHFGHPGLLDKDPQDIYREYLYGQTESRKVIHDVLQKNPSLYDFLLKELEALYLGEPGAATKAFFPHL